MSDPGQKQARNGDAGPHPEGGTSERVRRIIERIQAEAEDSHRATFTTQAYTDQPIMRTGADLARARQEAGPAETAKHHGNTERAASVPSAPGAPLSAAERRERRRAQAHAPARRAAKLTARDLAFWDLMAESVEEPAPAARPHKAETALPETLQKLRNLASARDEQGRPLEGPRLFLAQADLARDFVDDHPYAGVVPWRRPAGYQDLPDAELRGYFTWRASWRGGERGRAPASFATLLAFELINGIGVSDDEDACHQLEALADACDRGFQDDWSVDAAWYISRWARDYALVHGLARQAAAGPEAAFAQAVCVLRQAERSVIAKAGLKGLSPADAPEKPDDAAISEALATVAGLDLERSPFVREHRESYDAVCARIFADLAAHCARRRKTLLVDGLVGEELTIPFTPFIGVPLAKGWEGEERVITLGAGCWVSYGHGRWLRHRPYQSVTHDKSLKHLLRAIDRQMRIDWDSGRPLKEIPLPKYQLKMVVERSQERKAEEEQAERRRFTVDISQLERIRSTAAVVRDALLVDEEREDAPEPADKPVEDVAVQPIRQAETPAVPQDLSAMPQPKSAEAQPAQTAAVTASAGPASSAPPAPYGLSETELRLARALLADEGAAFKPRPGEPSVDMLVDSLNEKLFDLVGDIMIEFDDSGMPCLVEDYREDLRGALAS